tara:strand:+ start:3956 stop:4267 length:312 start_codon:yes stop_codon:yes gene_type:complete
MTRADNCCERCGVGVADIPASIHHRKPRRMGGTKDPAINAAENLALLCGTGTTGCHGWVESNRAEAKGLGWLVADWESPETVPMSDLYGHRFIFDDDRRVDLA